YIEDILPMVVKRDGRREPFDRAKLRNSVLKACEKRSVGVQAVDDVVSDIEGKLHERAEKEVSSRELGELVMARLQRLDQVAYVRFASVYRQFNDVTQFMDEVKGLIKKEPKEPEKAKRRKVRGQGAAAGAPGRGWLTRGALGGRRCNGRPRRTGPARGGSRRRRRSVLPGGSRREATPSRDASSHDHIRSRHARPVSRGALLSPGVPGRPRHPPTRRRPPP